MVCNENRRQGRCWCTLHCVSTELSVMKPIHARWLVGLNDYLWNKPDVTTKVFKMAGKVEAVTKGLEPEDPFVWGKTSLGILRRNFDIFAKKNDLPQCCVVFSIVILLFSAIRSLRLRKSKGYTLDSGLIPARSEKRNNRSMPVAAIPPQNQSTGLSAPSQLNSKPSSSPQRTLQRSESKRS